jgi:hypothetical protein
MTRAFHSPIFDAAMIVLSVGPGDLTPVPHVPVKPLGGHASPGECQECGSIDVSVIVVTKNGRSLVCNTCGHRWMKYRGRK